MVLVSETSEMFSESFKWGGGDVIGQNHLAIKPNRMFNSELDFFYTNSRKNKWIAVNQ